MLAAVAQTAGSVAVSATRVKAPPPNSMSSFRRGPDVLQGCLTDHARESLLEPPHACSSAHEAEEAEDHEEVEHEVRASPNAHKPGDGGREPRPCDKDAPGRRHEEHCQTVSGHAPQREDVDHDGGDEEDEEDLCQRHAHRIRPMTRSHTMSMAAPPRCPLPRL